VAAVTVALAALAVNGALSPPEPAPVHPPAAQAPSSAATRADARTVTERLALAGFEFAYEVRGADDDRYPILISRVAGGVPADAREVPLSGTGARAWVGKDPGTGDNALWFRATTRNGGELFEIHSPRWTEADFVSLVRTGRPAS
jgi:hypothetical protein